MAKQKNRQSFWAGMDERERMYFVLALCCAALLLAQEVGRMVRGNGTDASIG